MGAGQATAVTSVTPPGPAAGATKMSWQFSAHIAHSLGWVRGQITRELQGRGVYVHRRNQRKLSKHGRLSIIGGGGGWNKSNPVRAWSSGAVQGRLPDGAASSTQETRESMRTWQATLGKGVHLVYGRVQCSSSYVFVILGIERKAVQNKKNFGLVQISGLVH